MIDPMSEVERATPLPSPSQPPPRKPPTAVGTDEHPSPDRGGGQPPLSRTLWTQLRDILAAESRVSSVPGTSRRERWSLAITLILASIAHKLSHLRDSRSSN